MQYMPHMVRTLRIQRGWTVPEFAQKSDISIKIAYEIEKDANYNMKWLTMKKVGRAFGLPVSIIFFPEEELNKRAMLANMFQHTVAVLRNLKAIREDKLTSTPPLPERARRVASATQPSCVPASPVLVGAAPVPAA